MSGTIFQNCLKAFALSRPLLAPYAEEYSSNAAGLALTIKSMPVGAMRTELIQTYADALKVVWGVMCIVSAAGLVATVFTTEYSLSEPEKMDYESEEDTEQNEVKRC